MVSALTGRFAHAFVKPDRSLARLNSSRRPSFFTTTRLTISARSYVVKRAPHAVHRRRRRVTVRSSESRLSATFVEGDEQYGHFIQKSHRPGEKSWPW